MGYYTVILEVFTFETKDEAVEYRDRLTDAFCDMPESAGYGSSTRIEYEPDEENT